MAEVVSPPPGGSPSLDVNKRKKLARRKKLSEDEEEELKSAFNVFDAEKSGKIRYRELKALMRALGFPAKKAEVKGLFRLYERDEEEDGLEFFEFREILMDKMLERDPAEEYKKAFSLFDKDKSGKISLRDLRLLARQIGEKIDDDVLLDMIDEFDLDGDGEIDAKEFLQIMSNDDIDC